jgi:hypothetical protein
MPSACRLSLKRAIEEVAREDGTLAALKTADYFAKRAARADFGAFDRLTGSSRSSKAERSRFAQERLWE